MAQWTQADVDALKAAMAQGARVVQYSDRTITFHSLTEMERLLGLMQAEVASITSAPRRWAVVSSKGF